MICNKLSECAQQQFSGNSIARCSNNNSAKCVASSDKRSEVMCSEKQKKYSLENTMRNHIISYKMDGGIIVVDKSVPEGTCKCDYLYVTDGDNPYAILIELKGKNVSHALCQIKESLCLFKDFLRQFSHVYGRIVVSAGAPDLRATPHYTNLASVLKNTFGGNLKIFKEKELEKHPEKDTEL